ncbi:MAG: hypothetical protein MSD82_06120 [Prevotella sp.]|nr:hypothetical protein [Prevotella sp.]
MGEPKDSSGAANRQMPVRQNGRPVLPAHCPALTEAWICPVNPTAAVD